MSEKSNMPVEPKQFDAKGEKNLKDPGSCPKDYEHSSNVDEDGIEKKEPGKME